MPKLIEIIGSPGSGKTFISSELQMLKKNNEQVYFHSSNWRNFSEYKNLNFLSKILIKLKVLIIIVIFYAIFYKRLFLKKIYKRGFFLRIILLFYRHLVSIELLKKALSNDKYLIMEPGIIMYFLQDYFYSDENITKKEIKIFNKFFLKTDYIVCTNCDFESSIKRLKLRERGLPQRMRGLNINEINHTIKKSNDIIDGYISNSLYLNSKIIKINTSGSVEEIKNKLLNLLD
jgi:thymidylate kinase